MSYEFIDLGTEVRDWSLRQVQRLRTASKQVWLIIRKKIDKPTLTTGEHQATIGIHVYMHIYIFIVTSGTNGGGLLLNEIACRSF